MKYNELIERRHYALARAKGHSSRDEAYGGSTFQERYDDPELHDLVRKAGLGRASRVLLVGTGTGADACWLADQGFAVTAVDFVSDAIEMAGSIAGKRGSRVEFRVADICRMGDGYGIYDAIVDDYCLQEIVSDQDRASVYSFVREHLEPNGSYLIVCAGYAPEKGYHDEYRRDDRTGIVLQLVKDDEQHLEQIVEVEGRMFVPVRRHLTAESISDELRAHGFLVRAAEGVPGDGALRVIAQLNGAAG
jgi:SAM-dependent methyltransferase